MRLVGEKGKKKKKRESTLPWAYQNNFCEQSPAGPGNEVEEMTAPAKGEDHQSGNRVEKAVHHSSSRGKRYKKKNAKKGEKKKR